MRVLIVGGGQVAALIARRLIREGNEVTVVERDAERCSQLEAELDGKIVQGSAVSVKTLRKAGIADAEMLIAVTSSDEVNVLACLIAQVEAKKQVKVARLRTHEADSWREITAGAGLKIDLIIHPETDLAHRILRVITMPGVSDIQEFAGGGARLFGMNVELDSWLAGKTLEDLQRAGPPRDSLIAMIFRGQQVIIPHGAVALKPGDHIYTMATRENMAEVMAFMGLRKRENIKSVFIVGGKQLGILLAERLEEKGVHVKLFERDAARCEKIATILKKTIVIHGDGTDQATLAEENIESADAFLALTNDDEVNIIASLLGRRMGVKKVVALINRLNYLSMVQRLGVNATISPRLSAADRILQFVRKGRVLSVTTFREEEAEAIELIAAAGSKFVGKKLRDIKFPRSAIVGAIAKPDGTVIVPRGEAVIEPGDRVIFFTLESAVAELEQAFLAESKKDFF
jgi:trk system potassium uptake protein TrkA